MIKRTIYKQIVKTIKNRPVTLITGARQVGKSTLCRELVREFKYNYVSLDNLYDYVPSSLKEVIITGVTSIEDYAFSGCSSLSIYCEATSQQSNWGYYWNPDDRPVYWGIIIK